MNTPKQQFNVYLEPRLIAAAKHRAIDDQLSLSDLVARSLHDYLQRTQENPMTTTATTLKLQPIVHVLDLEASVEFFEALGGTLITGSRDGDWAQVAIGGAEIGLLAHPPNPEQNEGRVELSFESEGPLDALQQQIEGQGVKIVRGAADEAFGAQLQIASPDGLLIKINSLDPSTFE